MKYKTAIKHILKDIIPPTILRNLSCLCSRYSLHYRFSAEEIETHQYLFRKFHGKPCFIIGGGSSVKNQDLSLLKGHFNITVSNVYVHPEIEIICPVFHVLPNIFASHGAIYPKEKFISWLQDMDEKLPETTTMCLDKLDKEMCDHYNIFTSRKVLWYGSVAWDGQEITKIELTRIPSYWSVSEVALCLAIYAGFNEINLIGMDHDWFNGLMVYFYDKKNHKVGINEDAVDFADSEFQMRRHATIFKKYKRLHQLHGKIFNCNANQDTYVDIFPKRTLEKALLDRDDH